jgi:hypothetical protein
MRAKKKITLTFHKLDWLEKITIVLCLWFLFYPKPYKILFTLLLIIPLLGLILNGLSGKPSIASLVEISKDKDGDDKYDVADFIDMAAIFLTIRVLIDFEFEDFKTLIIPGAITFICVILLLYFTHNMIVHTNKNKMWIISSVVFNLFLYSYAATYGVNCVYDDSKPQEFTAKVLDKRISRSKKHTSYYIEVTPWGHHHDTEEISVA